MGAVHAQIAAEAHLPNGMRGASGRGRSPLVPRHDHADRAFQPGRL